MRVGDLCVRRRAMSSRGQDESCPLPVGGYETRTVQLKSRLAIGSRRASGIAQPSVRCGTVRLTGAPPRLAFAQTSIVRQGDSMRNLRLPHHTTVVAYLGLFVALATGGAYAANTVFSGDIVDGQVKTVDLANAAVTTEKIAGGAVTTEKVKNDNLTGGDIAPNTLKGADIDESTLQGSAAGAVDHRAGVRLRHKGWRDTRSKNVVGNATSPGGGPLEDGELLHHARQLDRCETRRQSSRRPTMRSTTRAAREVSATVTIVESDSNGHVECAGNAVEVQTSSFFGDTPMTESAATSISEQQPAVLLRRAVRAPWLQPNSRPAIRSSSATSSASSSARRLAEAGRELRLRRRPRRRVVDDALDPPPQALGQPVEVAVERSQAGKPHGAVHQPEAAAAALRPRAARLPLAVELRRGERRVDAAELEHPAHRLVALGRELARCRRSGSARGRSARGRARSASRSASGRRRSRRRRRAPPRSGAPRSRAPTLWR